MRFESFKESDESVEPKAEQPREVPRELTEDEIKAHEEEARRSNELHERFMAQGGDYKNFQQLFAFVQKEMKRRQDEPDKAEEMETQVEATHQEQDRIRTEMEDIERSGSIEHAESLVEEDERIAPAVAEAAHEAVAQYRDHLQGELLNWDDKGSARKHEEFTEVVEVDERADKTLAPESDAPSPVGVPASRVPSSEEAAAFVKQLYGEEMGERIVAANAVREAAYDPEKGPSAVVITSEVPRAEQETTV